MLKEIIAFYFQYEKIIIFIVIFFLLIILGKIQSSNPEFY
jgi:hypothetical protein